LGEGALVKDFLSIDIDSTLSNDDIFEILSNGLPGFLWRRGDSDAQGTYVSGLDANGVKIQCWSGEKPMKVSVSFRSAKGMEEESKESLAKVLLDDLLPSIGGIKRVQ
jgi:hypothetical protein